MSHDLIDSATRGMGIEECRQQVMAAMKAVPDDAELIIAYEPVWAIGAEEPADADHVVGVTKAIRQMAEGRKGFEKDLVRWNCWPRNLQDDC
jgi:triosephosphate isomerase